MRGKRPSCTACRVSEKAPVMTAWLAMMVASVAIPTIGMSAQSGTSRKNGFSMAEVAEVGVKRLRARHRQAHGSEHGQRYAGVVDEEGGAMDGVDGREHAGVV